MDFTKINTSPTIEIKQLDHSTFMTVFYIMISSALVLIASLAWSDALSGIFIKIFGKKDELLGKISYAIFTTLIVIFFLWIFYRLTQNIVNKDE